MDSQEACFGRGTPAKLFERPVGGGGSKEPRTIVAEESPTHDGRFVPPKKKRRLDLFVKVPSLKDIPVVFSETES